MESALTAAALGIFGFMCLMSVFKPHWALVLIFSFFGYEQLLSSFLPLFVQKSWLVNVITILCVGMSILVAMLSGRRPFRGAVNSNLVMVYFLYAFATASIVYSTMPDAGMYFLRAGAPSILLMLVLLPLVVCGEEQIRKMCVPFLLVGTALILMILVSPRTEMYGLRLLIDMSYTMGSGERGNPLATAEVGGVMLIVAVLMEPKNNGLFISLLRAGSILLGLLIAFLVGSRGQLVFSVFFAVMFYPLAHETRNIKQFFIRAGSVGALAMILGITAKIVLSSTDATERFSSDALSQGISGRMYYITTIFGEYAAHPTNYIQGLGSGSFNAYITHDGDGYIYPHNLIVEILTHHGLIGFVVMIGIFGITAKHGLSLVRSGLSGTYNRSVVAIVLALSAYVTMISMKQGSFLLYPLPFYMFLVISKLHTRAKLDGDELFESEYYPDDGYAGEDGVDGLD